MTIKDLQTRSRELGRIRLGQKTSSGAPTKLDRFRLTSASEALIRQIADLYGGNPQPWDNNGAAQWEVIIDATRLPVLVPPRPLSQFYESWSDGGITRRCDGVTELLTDVPCLCDPDPAQRACKPTTRLNLVLRDVPGIGVWRLESKGYYSAVELPDVAEFLAHAGGYVAAWLSLEQRSVKRPGEGTKRFSVPTLEVDVTPAQLLSGNVPVTDPPALPGATPAALPAADNPGSDWYDLIPGATSVDEVRGIWADAKGAGMLDGTLEAALKNRAAELEQPPAGEDSEWARDRLWSQIVGASQYDTTGELERDMWAKTGATPDKATATQLRAYLDLMGVLA